MSFWTIRHPEIDRQGRCIGQTVVPITQPIEDAVREALGAAPIRPTRLFSSDLPRCAELAAALAASWQLEVNISPLLRELSFGVWENRHYDDIDTEDTVRWRDWCEKWKTMAPPEGESLEMLLLRLRQWVQVAQPDEQSVVVTHAGVIRGLRVLAGSNWDKEMTSAVPFLGWQMVDVHI